MNEKAVAQNIKLIYDRRRGALYALCLKYAGAAINKFRADQRGGRFWNNQSGAARDLMFSNAFVEGDVIGWFMAHAVEYGPYLELANNGKYQAIRPIMNEFIVPFDDTLKILEKEVERGKVGYFRKDSQANRVYYIHDKAVTLCGDAGGGAAKMGQYLFGCLTPDRENLRQNGPRFNTGQKFYTLTAQDKHGILIEGYIRKLTPIECGRLQTVPEDIIRNYSKYLASGKKLEVIAIPDEEEYLPPYFIPDVKANLKFSFTDRYELLLKPLTDIRQKQEILTV